MPPRSTDVLSAIAVLLKSARQRWPDFSVDDSVFVEAIARHLPEDATVETVAELHGDDVYLAAACAQGCVRALADFETAFGADITKMLRHVRASADLLTESHQEVRRHLFVAEPGRSPRIAEYAGRGPLRAFLRVVSVRIALQLLRKYPRAQLESDSQLHNARAVEDDPELQYLKALYRREFKSAFAIAVTDLEPRERSLLRYHLVDELTIDQVAAINGTPRSTTARHIAAARARLVNLTREHLATRLGIDDDELRSILRLVQSNADVSINRLLGSE